MTPQQRAASSVSIGSLSINALSNVHISPQQQLIPQTIKPALQPVSSVNFQNHQNAKSLTNIPFPQTPTQNIQSPQLPSGNTNTLTPQNINTPTNVTNTTNIPNTNTTNTATKVQQISG